MQAPGRRGGGPTPLGGRISPRGSASRERNHGVGDHPIPFRTRQLSPTSPKVLRREAAGGQVVPLAGGAFSRSAVRITAPEPMVRGLSLFSYMNNDPCGEVSGTVL